MELQKFLMEHKDDWEEILGKEPYCLKWNKWKGFVSFKFSLIFLIRLSAKREVPSLLRILGSVRLEVLISFSTMQNLTLRQLIGVLHELWKK